MNDIKLAETIASIKANLSCHYSDAADLDFMIKELKSKRDKIIMRLDKDCNLLESLVKDKSVSEILSESFIRDINDSIEFTRQFVSDNLK